MPPVSRLQVAGYALAAVVIVVLGVRYMQAQAREAPAAAAGGVTTPRSGADGGSSGAHDAGAVRIGGSREPRPLVHVAGAVRRPGVYRLRAGARVEEAVEQAGGARAGADVNAINLAAKVADGQQVVVPRRLPAGGAQPASSAAAAGTAGAAPAAPINLNTATLEQLDTLDGVGPATAQKIIDWRTEHGGFRSVDDLGQVPGIGPKRMDALRDKVQA